MLLYPGFAVVGELSSDDAEVYSVVLCLPLAIWLSLVLSRLAVSVWSLLVSLCCYRWFPSSPVAMAIADLL